MINSREKGKRGERYVCGLFKEYGYDAHRTQQFRGNTGEAPDIEGVPHLWIEVKFRERLNIDEAMDQAVHDAQAEGKGNVPVVIHKKNNKDTLVTLRFDDFMNLYREWEAGIYEEESWH